MSSPQSSRATGNSTSDTNGQGETVEECKKNLANGIALILEDRREDAQRGLPPDPQRDVVMLS